MVRKWHLDRGWADIGYHYVILNSRIASDLKLPALDGSVEVGRTMNGDLRMSDHEKGAHAYGFNSDSIGVCLIGKNTFTHKQFDSLTLLLKDLMVQYNIPVSGVVGHYELTTKKTCPNVSMAFVRHAVSNSKYFNLTKEDMNEKNKNN